MKKHKIVTYLFFIIFLLGFFGAKANFSITVDSVLKEQIIKVGQQKLQSLIQLNEQFLKEGKTDKLNFVINLNPEDYINDIAIPTKSNYLSSVATESNYNARLNQIYQNEGLECYLILINYFDAKVTATMPTNYTLDEVFNGDGFFQQNSNIETLKTAHESITLGILYGTNSVNRKRYVISLANYCSSAFDNTTGGTGCFGLYAPYTVQTASSPAIAYFEETFKYFKSYLKADQAFIKESSRDVRVDKLISDFEKSVKNYKKKALILQTNTTNGLEAILSFFSTEDRQLLTNEERRHILKVFCSNSILLTTEIEILNILNTVPRDSVNVLLNDLVTIDVNQKRLIKHLFDKFQNDDYKSLVSRLVQLVGNSTLYQHNLPDVEASLISNQISPTWSRVFEWSDCSTSTTIDAQSTDDCKQPSHWQHAEKRYFTITMSSTGAIEINGKYKKVEAVISNNGPYSTTYENITPSILNPYDLIVLVDKTTIDGLNDITETSGGTMVVPAFFLVYAKDKAFNRDVFETAMALTNIIGPEEILAKKLLSKLSGFKRLLKFFRKAEVLQAAGSFGKYSTKIDNAVSVLQKENLFANDALTFLDGEYRTVQTTQQVTTYRNFGGIAKVGGTFVTTKTGASKVELALLDEWNNSMRFEATINIPSVNKINIGIVGPQTSTNGLQTLAGGGDQIILPYQWNTQWVSKIVDKTTGKIYNSVSDFKIDFPNLVD